MSLWTVTSGPLLNSGTPRFILNTLLLTDFAGQRFGPTFRTIVVLITIFNMGIAMTAGGYYMKRESSLGVGWAFRSMFMFDPDDAPLVCCCRRVYDHGNSVPVLCRQPPLAHHHHRWDLDYGIHNVWRALYFHHH